MTCDSYNPKVQTLYRCEIVLRTSLLCDGHMIEEKAREIANSNDCEHTAKTNASLTNNMHRTDVSFMSDIEKDVREAASEFLSWCRFRDDVMIEDC